jgi:[amino group carrier protein]-lysine/ornithine hydrolase
VGEDELDALERLVRCYSPSGKEGPAVREFVRLATALGYSAHVDRAGNGIARRGQGHPRIDFLGHIDTVEGKVPVRRRAGVLFGRGAVDAKGPLVAALFAGRDLPGPGEYRVLAAVGEETDSRGARHLIRGSPPDALIAGEPSGWDGVTVGYKGQARITATFRGSRTHYSSPEPTAMDRAVTWVEEFRSAIDGARDSTPFHSMAMKTVGLASRLDGGSEAAEISIDLRLPPGRSTREVVGLLPRRSAHDSIDIAPGIEPVEVDRTNPVVRGLVAGIRAARGSPTLWRKGGTSDLNLAVRAWRVPAAAYGPGDARLDHTDRERLSRTELVRSVAVLRTALAQIRGSGVYSSTIGRRCLTKSPRRSSTMASRS